MRLSFNLLIFVFLLIRCSPSIEDQVLAVEKDFKDRVDFHSKGMIDVINFKFIKKEKKYWIWGVFFGKKTYPQNGNDIFFEAELKILKNCYKSNDSRRYFDSPKLSKSIIEGIPEGKYPEILKKGSLYVIKAQSYFDLDWKENYHNIKQVSCYNESYFGLKE